MEDHSIRSDEKKKNLFLKLRVIYSDVYRYNLTVYNLRVCLFCDVLKGPTMGLRGYPGIPSSEGLTGSIVYWLSMTKEDFGEIKEMLTSEEVLTFLKDKFLVANLYNELLKIRTLTHVAKMSYTGGLYGLSETAGFPGKSNDFSEIIDACLKLITEIEEDLSSIQGLVFPV
jgi:hypothetical protein